jgi:hypothetical protein
MPPPQPFASDTYLAWHDAAFPADAPLAAKLEELRAGLVAGSRGPLTTLAQVLIYAATYCSREYQLATRVPAEYDFSLPNALRGKPTPAAYDLLFKSTTSIVNKLWRKNVNAPPEVHLGTIWTTGAPGYRVG